MDQHVDRPAGLLDLAYEAVDLARPRQVDLARLQGAAAPGLGVRPERGELGLQDVAGPPLAPRSTKPLTMPLPMPRAAPVTMTAWLSK
jgi:hypothetical protein